MATTKTGVRNYKRILGELESLQGQSGLAAHRRATLMVQLFEDSEFRDEIGAKDDFAVSEFLDQYVDEFRLSFMEMRAMLIEFPSAESWSDGKLNTLYEKAREQIAARHIADRAAEPRPARSVNRVTQAELSKVVEEKNEFAARLKFIERQHAGSVSEIDQLRRENQDLKLELAKANGRIEELERLRSRELAAA